MSESIVNVPNSPGYFAHATAVIDPPVCIGEGTRIWHFTHIMTGSQIGSGCVLGQNVFIAGKVVLGNGCKIQNNVSIYEKVILADDVFIGPSVVFTNVVNPRAFIERKSEYRSTLVGRGASIGANATIVCGHSIGDYAFIAAGAVVTKDVPSYGLVQGVPGRLAGWVCRCATRLAQAPEGGLACPQCGSRYLEILSQRGDRTLHPETT